MEKEDNSEKIINSIENGSDIIEDLKFNINRANKIVRLYEKQKNNYLNLNLALITISSIIYGILLNSFNNWGILFLTISLLIIFLISAVNFIYSTIGNTTKGIKTTLCFYRNYSCQKIKEFSKNSVLGDLRIQIYNLHKYQRNYNKIAVKTRKFTLTGIFFLIILFFVSFLVNFIATLLNP